MPQIPTVGRIMYYYELADEIIELPVPLPMMISRVSEDGSRVAGQVLDTFGYSFAAQNVHVVQPEEKIPFGTYSAIAMWMPYQVAAHAAAQQTAAISLVP